MKKLFTCITLAVPLLSYGADTFNTLDTNGTAAATQSGTWTVQPGNTANTTAWKVDGSAVTQPVAGNVAAGATDSGNPEKVGGVFNTTLPTYTTGQRGDAQIDANGRLRIAPRSSAFADGDGGLNTSILPSNDLGQPLYTAARGFSLNSSTTWDRIRSGIITPTVTLTGHQNTLPWAIYNATPTVRTEGQGGPLQSTSYGSLVTKPYSAPSNDWSYAAAASGISNTTTAVTIQAAAAAGLKNYITSCQLSSDALGAATEFVIRDGAAGTVIWRQKIGTAGIVNGIGITFPSPLKSTAATLLEVATLTASITGALYVNCQGYIAP